MKKQYIKTMAGIILVLFCLPFLRELPVKGEELPWKLEWKQKKEYPYFQDETMAVIHLKEQTDPQSVHVWVNEKEQKILWDEEKKGIIILKKEGDYQILIQDDEKRQQKEKVWIETEDPSIPDVDTGDYKEGIWTRQTIQLKVGGSKAVSGIDHYECRYTEGKWKPLEEDRIIFSTSMKDEIFIRAVSKAGRESKSRRVLIRLWKEIPSSVQLLIEEPDKNSWYCKIPEIRLKEEEREGPSVENYFQLEDLDRKETVILKKIPKITKEGRYRLSTWSVDEAGNHSRKSEPLLIFIDSTCPQISIIYKEQWKNKTYCKRQEAKIKITDAHLSEDDLKVYTSGETLSSWRKVDGAYEQIILFQEEGKHFLEVSARDQAGNENRKSCHFIVDKTPPRLVIEGVENFKSYKKDIQWNVRGSDASPYEVETSVYKKKKQVTGNMLTEDGYYTMKVKAVDAAGNEIQKKIHFVINKAGIVIKIKDPSINRKRINGKNIRLSFLVESLEPVQVMGFLVNGIPKTFQWKGKEISLQDPIREDGDYQISLVLSDASGNRAVSDKISFTYDGKAPKVLVKGLNSEKKISYGEHLTICLDNRNDFFVSLLVDGKKMSVNKSKFSLLQEKIGKHEIVFIAKDQAGNISNGKITFRVEKVMPQILKNIIAPKDEKRTEKEDKKRKAEQNYGIFLWCVMALVTAGFVKNMGARL